MPPVSQRRRRSTPSPRKSSAARSVWSWTVGSAARARRRSPSHLGLSARHLRRLFQDQVGVTPMQLARSSRAHFARRLLDDTDLSSRRSPSRRDSAAFASSTAPSARSSARRRANSERRRRSCRSPGRRWWPPAPPHLHRPARLGHDARLPGRASDRGGRARLQSASTGGPSGSTAIPGRSRWRWAAPSTSLLTAHLPHWGGLIHVVQQVRRIFNLDADLETRRCERSAVDPLLGARIASHGRGCAYRGCGIRLRSASARSSGSRSPWPAPARSAGRVCRPLGTPVPGLAHFGLTYLFPTADRLAGADLTGIGLTGARIAAIHNFAGAVAGGHDASRSEPVTRRSIGLAGRGARPRALDGATTSRSGWARPTRSRRRTWASAAASKPSPGARQAIATSARSRSAGVPGGRTRRSTSGRCTHPDGNGRRHLRSASRIPRVVSGSRRSQTWTIA